MKRQLNYRFVWCLLVAVVALGVSIHFVHGFQVKRNAADLRDRATKAEEAEQPERALQFLKRYLVLVPDDVDALARYGLLMDGLAEKQDSNRLRLTAFFVLDDLLRRDASRDTERRRLVHIAMELGRYKDAKDHLGILEEEHPDDGDLQSLLGQCQEARGEYEGAESADEHYASAQKLDPATPLNYVRQAELFTERLGKSKAKADAIIADMIDATKHKVSTASFVEAAKYYLNVNLPKDLQGKDYKDYAAYAEADNDLARADFSVAQALKLAPSDSDVLQTAAKVAAAKADLKPALAKKALDRAKEMLASGQKPDKAAENLKKAKKKMADEEKAVQRYLKDARDHLKEGLKHHPKVADFYTSLARFELRDGNLDAAEKWVDAGLKELPKDGELLYEQAGIYLQRRNFPKAKENLKKLEKDGDFKFLSAFLGARISRANSKWAEAAAGLEEARRQFTGSGRQVAQLNVMLGQCVEQLGNPDQALQAYQQAVLGDPFNVMARVGLAAVLTDMGRYSLAIDQYRQLMVFPGAPADARIQLCRVLLLQTLRLPARDRDWAMVGAELDRAAQELPKSVDVTLLQAEWVVQEDRKRADESRRILDQARIARPEQGRLWVALADLDVAVGKTAQAMHLLDRALLQSDLRNVIAVQLARIRLLSSGPAKQARKALKDFEKSIQKMPNARRDALLLGLASAYLRIGSSADGERLWAALAKRQPENLLLRIRMFDTALARGDVAEENDLVGDIKGIEGGRGTFWRYAEASIRARRLAQGHQAESDKDRDLREAREFLTSVAELRPEWYRVPALEGELDLIADDLEGAITHFQDAVRKGDRRPVVVRLLVQLLSDRRRYAEAEEAIRTLLDQQQLLLASGLGRVAVDSLMRTGDKAGALDLALRSIPPGSKNYRDHLWLSDLLWTAGKKDASMEAVRYARDLAPAEPEPWARLVAALIRAGKIDEARETIELVRTKARQGEVHQRKAPLFLASCYEAVGDLDKAQAEFDAVLAAHLQEPGILLAAAAFSLRNERPAEADKRLKYVQGLFQRVIDLGDKVSPAAVASARRQLAIVLGQTGDYDQYREALALLAQNASGADRGIDREADGRARARLLASRVMNRKQAIRLFEDLLVRGTLTADEHQTLAQLYEDDNAWSKAQLEMLTLLATPQGKKPRYEAYYARLLLRHRQPGAARIRIANLEKMEPDSPRTKELKARLLAAQGKDDEAIAMLTELARQPQADLLTIAHWFEAIGRHSKVESTYRNTAERLYRQYLDKDPKPASMLVLAEFLARQGRGQQALELCERAARTGLPDDLMPAIVAVFRTAHLKNGNERLERWLQERLHARPMNPSLLLALADLYDYEERFAEAINTYRRVLSVQQRPLLAMNNLAFLLAFQPGKASEALELVNSAMRLVGETPALRDTRAVVYIHSGAAQAAIKDLQDVVEVAPGANAYFHLAQAYWQAQDKTAAADSLDKSRSQGLKAANLHALERPALEQLSKELAGQ